MNTKPYWSEYKSASFAPLNQSARFDVVVIGGGITGLTTAYLLKKAGKTVCLLEKGRLGGGDTGHTSAHLTQVTDPRLHRLVDTFGREAATLVWKGGGAAINTIQAIASELGADCDFRRTDGYLHSALGGNNGDADELRDEAKLATELGIAAQFVERVPYVDRPGIRFINQARFHPRAYLDVLAKAVHGHGSQIYEQSEVGNVTDDPLTIEVNDHQVHADYVVIATHMPLMGTMGTLAVNLLQTKLAAYSSYVVGGKAPLGVLPEGLYWDTNTPYYYLRVDAHDDHDYVIFGGCDHKTGQLDDTREPFDELVATLRRIAPEVAIDHHWSGQVIETNDHLPLIGETSDRQFIATGFAGNGMTFGTLAGMMATDRVLGRDNPWQDLLSVDRKKIRGGTWDYLKENIDFPYYLVTQRLMEPMAASVDEIAPGEGKLLKLDGQRVACSRAADGSLQMVSAVCTHMGCLVHWNRAEGSWDCPCHGSRFATDGKVLAGPAVSPLEPIAPAKPAARRRRPNAGSGSEKANKTTARRSPASKPAPRQNE